MGNLTNTVQVVRDPVCGMEVEPSSTSLKHDYEDQTYYFCSVSCRDKFIADPNKYINPKEQLDDKSHNESSNKTEYTCPMHPQIVRSGPGSCPICGMALEPRTVSLDEGDNPELREMKRRFWVGTALTVPVVRSQFADD